MLEPNPDDIARLFSPSPEQVIETHISRVFLCGDRAWKLKKAVSLPYVDFATLEQRHIACEREVTLNRRTAPELYLGCRAVYREGRHLTFTPTGRPVEWLVEMRRFPPHATFDELHREKQLNPALIETLADTIARFHATADPVIADAGETIGRAMQLNRQAFERLAPDALPANELAAFQVALQAEFERQHDALARRQAAGHMRHCHGDLHLRNIALIDGRPVLFDCLEFDDGLAWIDTLYDFAFLLMDLLQHDCGDLANLALNHYLEISGDYDGLRLLPFYVAMRAAIRCHIAAMTPAGYADARRYLALAVRCLCAAGTRLVAVAGFSGTGKTTIARKLAPGLGGYPWGGVLLRSDVLRKHLHGVGVLQSLPKETYTADSSRRTYAAVLDRAKLLLHGGSSVLLDAVFGRREERDAAVALAAACGMGFTGLWLTAPPEVLIERVSARRNDASDATAAVARWQWKNLQPPVSGEQGWQAVDASGKLDCTLARARIALAAA